MAEISRVMAEHMGGRGGHIGGCGEHVGDMGSTWGDVGGTWGTWGALWGDVGSTVGGRVEHRRGTCGAQGPTRWGPRSDTPDPLVVLP